MRLRLAVLATLVTTLVAVAATGVAGAAPGHNRGLTINAIPNPIDAGEGVFIYGHLNVAPVGGQTIVLYHHLAGSGLGYSKIGRTTTDSHGFYEFTRAEDVVMTNRSWFVREQGVHQIHSRTVFERVAALVSIAPSTASAVTGEPVTFTGTVTPNHAFERVVLQEQTNSGEWRDLKSDRLDGGSNYSITYRWRFAADHTVRVLFPQDVRNIAGASDQVTVAVQQKQVSGFTINSSDQLISYGQSVTISGVVDGAALNTPVTLWARNAYQSQFTPVADTTTGTGGSYTFAPQVPGYNTVYIVRTTLAPHRHSASLFEGVQDVLTMTPSSPTSQVGGHVTFTGTVLPDKAGHVIYLQRLGADGDWHNEEIRFVTNASTFQFSWTFGKAGTYQFRARITGDRGNVGGASAPVTIQVSPTTTTVGLPQAS
ncbi:MAG TPA: hypothetical protein VHZ27_19795 [Solirubrobacteraceae bacterium]|jgi:hypothetical protein|nr:hypothetical protein [Solirubrobacteraceae bacterium]